MLIFFRVAFHSKSKLTKKESKRRREREKKKERIIVICNTKHMRIDALRPVQPPSKWISNS